MLAAMLLRRKSSRPLARLIAGVFTLQMIVAGFCLLPQQTHAMPASMQVSEHCDSAEMSMTRVAQSHQQHDHQQSVCAHCAQPDGIAQAQIQPDDLSQQFMFVPVVAATDSSETNIVSSVVAVRVPTGPPRSHCGRGSCSG